MIRNARPGQLVTTPAGNTVKIAQVLRNPDGRVRVVTAAGDEYTAWELKAVYRRVRRVKG